MSVLKKEVVSWAGSIQVCAGQDAGSEALIRATEKFFKEESTEAVLLIDAENAFNSINRKVFLRNISILCPPLSLFVTNCYATSAWLFVIIGSEIKPNEGTIGGDPVGIEIYALGITPLTIMMVELVSTKCDDIKMFSLAHDFSAEEKLKPLLQWWMTLPEVGPKFGYFAEATKSWLLAKPETHAIGKELFKDTKEKIGNSGKRSLGSVIGTLIFKKR